MSGLSHGLSVDEVAIYVAVGMGFTLLALGMVFGGFFSERRLRDRLEDLKIRTGAGSRAIQLASLRRVEQGGRVATFDRLMGRWFPSKSKMRQKLQASGLKMTLGDFALACLFVAIVLAFLFYVVFALPAAVALLGALTIGIGLPNVVLSRKARKRGQKFNLLFPDAVDLIVRSLRAGLPVQEAIGSVAQDIKDPVGDIFRRAQQQMQLGVPIEAALWQVAKTIQTEEFNFLIIALSIQRDTGGNLAETLNNLSVLLRARQQLRLKIRAFTSEARATMLIMAGLPFLVGGGLFLISPQYISPLITTSTGQMVLAGAACSMGLGIFIMNKIATIKV